MVAIRFAHFKALSRQHRPVGWKAKAAYHHDPSHPLRSILPNPIYFVPTIAGLCFDAFSAPTSVDLDSVSWPLTERKWYRTISAIIRVPRKMAREFSCWSVIIVALSRLDFDCE